MKLLINQIKVNMFYKTATLLKNQVSDESRRMVGHHMKNRIWLRVADAIKIHYRQQYIK